MSLDAQQPACLHCGRPVPADAMQSHLPACPFCGQLAIIDDQEPHLSHPPDPANPAELNSLRLRQIITERRGMIRTRTYLLAGTVACVVVAVQSIITAIQSGGWAAAAELGLALILLAFAWRLGIQTRQVHRRFAQALQHDPARQPDFTSLSDGSQHRRNLEELNDQR